MGMEKGGGGGRGGLWMSLDRVVESSALMWCEVQVV